MAYMQNFFIRFKYGEFSDFFTFTAPPDLICREYLIHVVEEYLSKSFDDVDSGDIEVLCLGSWD